MGYILLSDLKIDCIVDLGEELNPAGHFEVLPNPPHTEIHPVGGGRLGHIGDRLPEGCGVIGAAEELPHPAERSGEALFGLEFCSDPTVPAGKGGKSLEISTLKVLTEFDI